MKPTPISRRRFVLCHSQQREVPVETKEGCCEFYNASTNRCDFSKYSHVSSHKKLSERDEVYRKFSQNDETEE